MDLIFEQGDQSQPRGHAILYYRSGGHVWAAYMVVLPLKVDFTKYIPPVLASQVKLQGLEEFSAFAIPPVPEEAKSLDYLKELAQLRRDDLVYGGEADPDDFLDMAQRVSYAVQSYTKLYQEVSQRQPAEDAGEKELPGATVNEVLLSFMGEKEKLAELAKLVGKLQFAMDSEDKRLISETEEEMRTLAGFLPENYRVSRLIETARQSADYGPKLAQLYLERCYKLANEDYAALRSVDEAIRDVEQSSGRSPRSEEP